MGTPPQMRYFKVSLRIAGALGGLCLLLAAGGALYAAATVRHYRTIAGVPGRLYPVGGHAMHLYCTGEGSPTIMLESGLGDDFTIWAKVQPALSRVTRVCAHDRAGFGWSEPRPDIQDANTVAAELHELTAAAEVPRPFILMGHSIAGLYLRAYAAHYPQDLAGLVFVDGATPLQDDRVPRELLTIQKQQRREMPWQKLLLTLGWYQVRGLCTQVSPGFENYAPWIKAVSCAPAQIDAMENELDAVPASGEETLHAGTFGKMPVLIFSRDPQVLAPNWPAEVSKANAVVWNQMQEEAKGLSSQSRRIIARGSDHYLQIDRADLLDREVTAFVRQIRENSTFAEHNHTTIEE